MKIKGKAHVFGDNINTDFIISGRYKFSITDINELAKHIMEDIDPGFYDRIEHGNAVIVAGENFGMGSSREQAPLAIKAAGINAVIAKSFARIFFRNAINVGLPLVEVNTSKISEGDLIEADLDQGMLIVKDKGLKLKISPYPKVMQDILEEGGMIRYFAKYKDLKI